MTRAARVGVLLPLVALLLVGRTALTPSAHASTVGHPPTFGSASTSTIGPSARSAVVADVNGDGKPDLVTANQANDTVSVLLGNGDGTFTAKPDLGLSSSCGAHGIAVADLNGDGKPDLVVACSSESYVAVFIGVGDGTFGAEADYATDTQPMAVAIADVNGDGIPDLVTANESGNIGACTVNPFPPCIYTVSVLLGKGDGTFQTQQDFETNDHPESVAIGDVNGDGKPDLVVGTEFGWVSVLLGNGDGTFQAYQPYAAGDGAPGIALADLNGDGKLDIAVPDPTAGQAETLLGNGDGTFQPYQYVLTGGAAQSVAVADVNGDGKPDLLTEDANDNNVSLELGNGDGTFGAPQPVDIAGEPPGVVLVADVNRDGAPDIVTANTNSTASVALQTSSHTQPGTFQPFVSHQVGATPANVVAADVNGDGKLDLVTANISSDSVSVLLGNGDGSFQAQRAFSTGTGSGPNWVAVADLNRDGKPDIVTANIGTNTVSVLLGDGAGGFHTKQVRAVGNLPSAVAIADVNRDGIPDLVVANSNDNTVSVLLGNGDGTFKAQRTFKTGAFPASVAVADVSGDGKPDIVTANESSNSVTVLLGKGDGTFQPPHAYKVGRNPVAVTVADMDLDGKPDLVVADSSSDYVSLLLGNGDGTFQGQRTFSTFNSPNALAVADVNGDGRPDIVASLDSSNLTVLLANGPATFSRHRDLPTGSGVSATVADLNGDGKPDLISDFGTGGTTPGGIVTAIQFGRLDHFVVEAAGGGPIGTQQQDVPFGVRITAKDLSGNTVTSYTGTAAIGANGMIVGGSFTSTPFSAGSVTQQLALDYPGTGAWVSATQTGGAHTGKSNTFTLVAPDGAGTAFPAPSWVANGAAGSTVGFEFLAGAGGMSGGKVSLVVPAGWPAPSLTGTDPGYVTSSRGTVAVANRTIKISGLTCVGGAATWIYFGSKAGGGPGVTTPTTGGDQTWPFRSQEAAGGSLQPLVSSPVITVLSPNGSGTLNPNPSAVNEGTTGTITFDFTAATGGVHDGYVKLTVPSGWPAPSTTPTDPGYVTSDGDVKISSRTIIVSNISLGSGNSITIQYGAVSGGGPGATAPNTPGPQVWNASEISNIKSGGYVAFATSPTITIQP